jgi:hypothetical protein
LYYSYEKEIGASISKWRNIRRKINSKSRKEISKGKERKTIKHEQGNGDPTNYRKFFCRKIK